MRPKFLLDLWRPSRRGKKSPHATQRDLSRMLQVLLRRNDELEAKLNLVLEVLTKPRKQIPTRLNTIVGAPYDEE